jgi:hypothetical protein
MRKKRAVGEQKEIQSKTRSGNRIKLFCSEWGKADRYTCFRMEFYVFGIAMKLMLTLLISPFKWYSGGEKS